MQAKSYAIIEPVKYGLDAICTVISDDGRITTVEEWYKLALKYNIKVTVAQVVENITNLHRLQEIEGNGKVEFISHSYGHLKMDRNDIPESVLWHEIVEAKEFIESHFLTSQLAFVPPHNQLSEKAYDICEGCFYAIRRWNRELNYLSPLCGKEPLNWLNLGCKGIGDVHTTQERNLWVDECIEKKKWLIEMWHDINEDPLFGYQTINSMEAEEHIAYICSKDRLWMASFIDAVKYIYEKQTTEVKLCNIGENRWHLCLSKGISKTDLRFDMPLSVKVNLCCNCEHLVIERNGEIEEYVRGKRKIGGEIILLLEMLPGENIVIRTNT